MTNHGCTTPEEPPRAVLSRRRLLIGAGALSLAAAGGVFVALDRRLEVTERTLEIPGLRCPVTMAVLADLHSEPYTDGGAELLEQVRKLEPDLILMPGDIVDDVLPEGPAHRVVEGLTQIAPTFWTSGNHDAWTDELPRIKQDMQRLGAMVLEGEAHQLEVRGTPITVLGLDDPDAGQRLYHDELRRLGAVDPEGPAVLLAHRPERLHDYRDIPADLVVSGHAHGGQWRLPLLLEQGLLAPNQGLLPQRTSGVFEVTTARGNAYHVVSRGLATRNTIVPRIFNRPEIVKITAVPPGSTESE